MKYRWQREITRSEYYYLINMISNRLENLTYQKSQEYAKIVLDKIGGQKLFKKLKANNELDITLRITFLGNDLIEILGGYEK
jgi:hypothetical protein